MNKNLIKRINTLTLSILSVIFMVSCSNSSNVEGDIFLIKGDGSPQPAAARDIFYIPIDEENLDPGIALTNILNKSYELAYSNLDFTEEELNQFCNSMKPEVVSKADKSIEDFKNFISKNKFLNSSDLSCDKQLANKSTEEYLDVITNNNKTINDLSKKDSDAIRVKQNSLHLEIIEKLTLSFEARSFYLTNNSDQIIYIDYGDEPEYKYISEDGIQWGGNIIKSNRNISIYKIRNGYPRKDEYGLDYDRYDVFMMPGDKWRLFEFLNYPSLMSNDTKMKERALKIFRDNGGKCEKGYNSDTKIFHIAPYVSYGTTLAGCYSIDTTKLSWLNPREQFRIVKFPVASDKGYIFDSVDLNAVAKKFIGEPNKNNISKLKDENKVLQKNADELQSAIKGCDAFNSEEEYFNQGINYLNQCNFSELRLNSGWWKKFNGEFVNDSSANFYIDNIDNSIAPKALLELSQILDSGLSATTSIMGNYKIAEVPSGNYLVLSEYIDNFNQGTYIKTANLSQEEEKQDLSNNHFIEIPLTQLVKLFFQECDDKGCPKTKYWIQEAINDYKEYLKTVDDIENSLQDLEDALQDLEDTLRWDY